MSDLRPYALIMLLAAGLQPTAGQAENEPTLEDRLHAVAKENRLRLDYDGTSFAGPAWELMLREGRQAQFFAIGEEHGIAENPRLAAALFAELVKDGYSKLVIEISPPMATALDQALQDDGVRGLHNLYAQDGAEPAFYGMQEEVEFLAAVRAAAPAGPVLWGADYEVGADRYLLRQLAEMPKPAAAADALAALTAASMESWARYHETGSPQYIFSFGGDPQLVRALKAAWPERNSEADWILDTLEETLEVNRLWVEGKAWRSNERRAALLRNNFLRYWRQAEQAGQAPRVMLKLGGSHLVRGINMTDTFDLGTMLPELAALEGRHSFNVLVLPGVESQIARFNPVDWSYQPAPAKDGYAEGLEPIVSAAHADAFTLIDLRPLRPIIGMRPVSDDLRRTVLGFDALLVMSGSTPSRNFGHQAAD
jgi:hypothetical protein